MRLIDQLGREVILNHQPSRIVSLVPSQTELISFLGGDEILVGITKFCIHPNHIFKSKARIGGTKDFSFERIAALKPDLIIGNKEENTKEGILKLEKEFPVWMSDISTLKDALEMISKVGVILQKEAKAQDLQNKISDGFARFKQLKPTPKKVVYLIWNKPYMAAGSKTFIGDMQSKLGFENLISASVLRYPELSDDDLINLNPEIVLLSSEPFPFKEKHVTDLQSKLPNAKILLVDGEMFSWYGNRLLQSVVYFENLINQLK